MFIESLSLRNFKTFEDVSIKFPNYYSAICGKNNSGKSNLLRVLRFIFGEQEQPYWFYPYDLDDLNYVRDFTNWKAKAKQIEEGIINIVIDINLYKEDDEVLIKYIHTFIAKDLDFVSSLENETCIKLKIEFTLSRKTERPLIAMVINGFSIDDYAANEFLRKLRDSEILIFHNSTETSTTPFGGTLSNITDSEGLGEKSNIKKRRDDLIRALNNKLKQHQKDFAKVLNQLEDKYSIGLSFPKFSLERIPIEISLGEKEKEIPLAEWGSGTRNKTKILMHLFNVQKSLITSKSSDKIKPIILIEEPECYLHWSAQAEFGGILQNLAKDLKVQVIATTHSPYMLSKNNPNSNILLERRKTRNKLRETNLIDTSGDCWLEPYRLALGFSGSELKDFKDIVFSDTDKLLLVEGDSDKEYLLHLMEDIHGVNKLVFDGEIKPLGGITHFKDSALMNFIKSLSKKIYVVVDLDRSVEILDELKKMGLKKNKEYFFVGEDTQDNGSIEGLLPQELKDAVYAENPRLVNDLMSSDKYKVKRAKCEMKNRFLEKLKETATEKIQNYEKFYKIVKQLNKAFNQ